MRIRKKRCEQKLTPSRVPRLPVPIPILVASIVMFGLSHPSLAVGQATYYIDENTYYAGGGGCPANNNLNTITASLATAMSNVGWTGYRYIDQNAIPTDFEESCNISFAGPNYNGSDNLYGDNYDVTVFAGHGNAGFMSFAQMDGNLNCGVDFQFNMRLGSMAGSQAGFALYLFCSALQTSSIPTKANSEWLQQQFGWANTISIGNNEPRDVFNGTSSQSNRTSWFGHMGGSGRQPVVLSQGSNSSDCWNTQNKASWRQNIIRYPRAFGPSCSQGQPSFYYCYEVGS